MEDLGSEPKEKLVHVEELISRRAWCFRVAGELGGEAYRVAARQVNFYMAFEDSIGIHLR